MSDSTSSAKIFNHRGRGRGKDECSIIGIREALKSDIDGILFEIYLTDDLRWVVPKKLNEQTVLKIHTRPLSSLKNDVLDLDSVLALFATYAESKEIILDIRDIGELRSLRKHLVSHDLLYNTTIVSWFWGDIHRVHNEIPSVRLGVCVPTPNYETVHIHATKQRKKTLFRYSSSTSYEGWPGIRPSERVIPKLPTEPISIVLAPTLLCSPNLSNKVSEKGAKLVAFTVNRQMVNNFLRRTGVEAFLSNSY